MTPAQIILSELDTQRFGVAITRADIESSELSSLIAACRENGIAMAVLRTDAASSSTVQAIEAAGGVLCDTLVTFTRPLVVDIAGSPTAGIREAFAEDADEVAAIAAAAFVGYGGHYHADERLDRASADAAYVDWARRSCAVPGTADRVWVVERARKAAGFLTLRINDPTETEIVLNAVHPDHQRRGLYRDLVLTALAASRDLGAERCIVSTQLSNVQVQRIWTRVGFEPASALHTFHLWFD